MVATSGRKPADAGNPGREAIWAAIRTFKNEPFTVGDIIAKTGAQNKTIRDFCKALAISKYLREEPQAGGQLARWTLINDIGIEAPRVRRDGTAVTQGSVTEQLWRGMYIQKEFTHQDLTESASIKISQETSKAYCKMLLATGYLRVLIKASPTKGRLARYRLIRNNGPKPPQIQRVKQVYDPNTREVFAPGGQA